MSDQQRETNPPRRLRAVLTVLAAAIAISSVWYGWNQLHFRRLAHSDAPSTLGDIFLVQRAALRGDADALQTLVRWCPAIEGNAGFSKQVGSVLHELGMGDPGSLLDAVSRTTPEEKKSLIRILTWAIRDTNSSRLLPELTRAARGPDEVEWVHELRESLEGQ